jgi:hypothetical protein
MDALETIKPLETSEVQDRQLTDLYPEISFQSESDLTKFLDRFRESMTFVMEGEGMGFERCGLTSALTRRALLPKNEIVAISDIGMHRMTDEIDEASLIRLKQLFGAIGEQSSLASEAVRYAFVEFCHSFTHPTNKDSDESMIIDDFLSNWNSEFQASAREVADYLLPIWRQDSEWIIQMSDYLSSGWGHTAVGIVIHFGEDQKQLILDLNAEQYGSEFDRLFIFTPEDALLEGVTTQKIRQVREVEHGFFGDSYYEKVSQRIAEHLHGRR